MRKQSLVLGVAAAGLLVSYLIGTTLMAGQPQVSGFGVSSKTEERQTGQRSVKLKKGKSLVDELRPNDETLILVDEDPPGLPPPPAPPGSPDFGKTTLQLKAEASRAVIEVEVISVSSSLNPAKTEITSTVTGEIHTVIAGSVDTPLNIGQQVNILTLGNEITLGRQKIKTVRSGMLRDIEIGRRYLVFITKSPKTQPLLEAPISDWLLVNGDRVQPLTGPGALTFGGTELQRVEFFDQIAAFAANRR